MLGGGQPAYKTQKNLNHKVETQKRTSSLQLAHPNHQAQINLNAAKQILLS